MKRTRFFAALLGLAACLLMMQVAIAPALPAVPEVLYKFNDQREWSNTLYNPCVDEEIVCQGTMHLVGYSFADKDGVIHWQWHYQLQGATGVGQTSGLTYQINFISRENGIIDSDENPAGPITWVAYLRFIAPGKDNNFLAKALFHLTVNGNGETTVYNEIDNVECK